MAMRLCKLASLARRACLHSSIVELQYGGMSSIWLTNSLRISQAASPADCARFSAAAAQPAVAHDQDLDNSSAASDQDMQSSTIQKLIMSPAVGMSDPKEPAEGAEEQPKPVQLSDVVRALDFDWDDRSSEDFGTDAHKERADSGLSASTSETSNIGSKKKTSKWRAPSKGGVQPRTAA